MLDIPKTFLKEERRDGYYISEMMKRTWAAQLGILDSLKKIFDRYGLRYFADYGTLLGAVRHKGYIPWDDDLDISMPRKDLLILLEHADELDEDLTIRSIYNSDSYMNFNVVVTHKTDILKWDERRMEKYYGCPFICYVDIFPWDYIPRDKERLIEQSNMFNLAFKLMYDLRNIETVLFYGKRCTFKDLNRPEIYKYQTVQEFVGECKTLIECLKRHPNLIEIDQTKKLRQQLCIVADRIASMCPENEADYVDYALVFRGGNVQPRKRKEWQDSYVELPFEFGAISAPAEYIKILESKYGKDYLNPVRYKSDHGYPFFRNEIRVLIGGDTGEILTDDPIEDPSIEAIPEEIRQCLIKDDGDLKRIVLFGLSATDVINGGKLGLNHILSNLQELDRNDDIVTFLFVPFALREFMAKCNLKMQHDYVDMLEKISGMKNVILDEKPETAMLWSLISICDEYYGDRCRLSEICEKYDIPVTIQDYQPDTEPNM